MKCKCGGEITVKIEQERDDSYTGTASCDKCARLMLINRDERGEVCAELERSMASGV